MILPALRLVEPSRIARRLAAILAVLFVLTPCALIWLPWRQSVSGAGRVVGYAPLDRQYNIEAPIYGRVQEWFVAEGTKVEPGQPIARISDNDSEYLAALESQRDAALAKLATAKSEVELYEEVTARFEEVREMAVNAAENYVDVARQKVAIRGAGAGRDAGGARHRLAAIPAADPPLPPGPGLEAGPRARRAEVQGECGEARQGRGGLAVGADRRRRQGLLPRRGQGQDPGRHREEPRRDPEGDGQGGRGAEGAARRPGEDPPAGDAAGGGDPRRHDPAAPGQSGDRAGQGRRPDRGPGPRRGRAGGRAPDRRQRHAAGARGRPRPAPVRGLARRPVRRLALGGGRDLRREGGARRLGRRRQGEIPHPGGPRGGGGLAVEPIPSPGGPRQGLGPAPRGPPRLRTLAKDERLPAGDRRRRARRARRREEKPKTKRPK